MQLDLFKSKYWKVSFQKANYWIKKMNKRNTEKILTCHYCFFYEESVLP